MPLPFVHGAAELGRLFDWRPKAALVIGKPLWSKGNQIMTSLEKAKQLADKAYSDYIGLESILRQDAQLYATIALAEAIERLTVALERNEGAKVVSNATH